MNVPWAPRFGLFYNHDVGSKGWPCEVHVNWYEGYEYEIVDFPSFKCTVWCLPRGKGLVSRAGRPLLCNRSPYNIDTTYSAFYTFVCGSELSQWQEIVLESDGEDVVQAITRCGATVLALPPKRYDTFSRFSKGAGTKDFD